MSNPTGNKFPSDFMKHPYDSIFQNNEAETILRNIMVILKRTGNIWRELSFEEYKSERNKDGGWSDAEEGIFEKVVKYSYSELMAWKFSKNW